MILNNWKNTSQEALKQHISVQSLYHSASDAEHYLNLPGAVKKSKKGQL